MSCRSHCARHHDATTGPKHSSTLAQARVSDVQGLSLSICAGFRFTNPYESGAASSPAAVDPLTMTGLSSPALRPSLVTGAPLFAGFPELH